MFTKAETIALTERLEQLTAPLNDPDKHVKNADYRQKWMKKMAFLDSIAGQTNAAMLLHDTSVNRFLYFSDKNKILGNYDPADFTSEVGVDFSFSNIHPQQRSAALLIQLKIISYGFEHPHTCLNNIIGNMTFQYKRKGGQYFQILQKSMVVETDADGYPLLYLRFIYDISHLVRPCVGLIINAPDQTLIWNYNANKKCLDQVNLLSVQEKKILALLAEGNQSKEIAELVFSSSHTVDTHRRNLLKKTHCIDTTALITFGKMTGLI